MGDLLSALRQFRGFALTLQAGADRLIAASSWSLDFLFDQLVDERRFRIQVAVDDCRLRDEFLAVKGFWTAIIKSVHCLPPVTIKRSLSYHDSDGR